MAWTLPLPPQPLVLDFSFHNSAGGVVFFESTRRTGRCGAGQCGAIRVSTPGGVSADRVRHYTYPCLPQHFFPPQKVGAVLVNGVSPLFFCC